MPVIAKFTLMPQEPKEAIREWDAQKGLNSKIHLDVDAHGMPASVIVTAGTAADCSQAGKLIEGIDADNLIAAKGCDSGEVVELAQCAGMQVVIPPRKNRRVQRVYDKYLYHLRYLVENAFFKLKQWRGITTRYAKNTASFLAAVHIRCIVIWAKIYCRYDLEIRPEIDLASSGRT